MIGTIRRHQQWLWILIIAVTIVTFVIFFSPNIQLGSLGRKNTFYMYGKEVLINGRPISTADFHDARREVALGYFLRSGGKQWPGEDARRSGDLDRQAVLRLFLLQRAEAMGIEPSDKAVALQAKRQLGTLPPEEFERRYLLERGYTLADYERFLRHDLMIRQLQEAAAVPAALVDPKHAEALYKQENEETLAKLAVFWASNYLDRVLVNDEEIARYYTNHMANYRLPEQVVVKYVTFPASNYLAEAEEEMGKESVATNLTAAIEERYLDRGTNYYTDTNGVPLPEAEAKERIRSEFQQGFAVRVALRKAYDFANQLYSLIASNQTAGTAQLMALEQLAAAQGLVVGETEPFDRVNGLEDAPFPDEFRQKALELKEDAPISFRPIPGTNAVYLIGLAKKIPSKLPPLAEVRDKVVEDYKRSRALDICRQVATSFRSALTNRLARGEDFETICRSSNIEVISLPPFAPSTSTLTNLDERITFRTVKQVALSLKPKEVSRYIPTPFPQPEGGFLLYVEARRPVSEEKLRKELPEYIAQLRDYRRSEAFNRWFRKQAEDYKLFIPQESPEVSAAN